MASPSFINVGTKMYHVIGNTKSWFLLLSTVSLSLKVHVSGKCEWMWAVLASEYA